MNLRLARIWPTPTAILGALYINNAVECFTLEPGLTHGKGPIPAGRYKVIITPSVRFKREMPLLVDVPGFEGIRIHCGNTESDTEGCILLGTLRVSLSVIGDSRTAFNHFFTKLEMAISHGETVDISVEDTLPVQRMIVTDPEIGM